MLVLSLSRAVVDREEVPTPKGLGGLEAPTLMLGPVLCVSGREVALTIFHLSLVTFNPFAWNSAQSANGVLRQEGHLHFAPSIYHQSPTVD